MASTPLRRLFKEHQSIQRDLASSSYPDVVELRPYDTELQDLTEWTACLRGPQGGVYAGGLFNLHLTIPPTYPTKPPLVKFTTSIFHPNVNQTTGEICLDILSDNWSPAWTLLSLSTAILALLESPEPDSPLNVDAANLYRSKDQTAYASVCRMYTSLFAMPQ
ncbi:E2 ubiquitin-protein ligase peroxin 4 [Thecaphora frezii]